MIRLSGFSVTAIFGCVPARTTDNFTVTAALAGEEKAKKIKDQRELAFFYKDKILPIMEALRTPADKLEMLVDKKDWPIPTYADLLFEG